MLGSRRTVSFWQPKKQLLKLARALRARVEETARPALPAQSLAVARVRSRIAAEGKRKARFSEY
ncbi:MAG: hypothetical protein JOY64_06880 [Alphaproteobacteria bacterium]|nr:hypothetical protein [Alphaproteobacteria bacterium]MBV8407336.1 hypothetical protein [Alphaproteobacteria bacterium]